MANLINPRGRQDDDNYGNPGNPGNPGNTGGYGNRGDQPRGYDQPRPEKPRRDDDKCGDGTTPTDKSIQTERGKVCNELKDKAGEVRVWEQNRLGAHQLYNDKKCCFVQTETNYQYYRNIELMIGVELLQVNEGIKENVAAYKKWNDELAAVLKELVKTTKEAKGKFSELKDAACKLNTCINDSCQSTQMKILTGESYDNCKDNDTEIADKCNAKEVLHRLETIPNTFLHDIDTIFNSATRVAGIQVFSNVASLEPLQKTLQEKSKAFDDFIIEKMKKGSEDLKKTQEELSKAVQELTKSTTGLYFRRADFKGVHRAIDKLCDCHCDCINNDGDEGRLERCKCDICDICDQVKAGVCNVEDNPVCRPRRPREEPQTQNY